MLEGRKRKSEFSAKKTNNPSSTKSTDVSLDDSCRPSNERNMTRKTRTRRPRIQVLQSGYCAICNLPYNSIEDHIKSKKHQKLIGEDANYIALNGYIHSDVGIESLLSLTGIDAIGFDTDFSPKVRRRNMPRTRSSSVVSDIKPTQIQSENDSTGHHLRSRKNINYMTPPLDEDSDPEKPDLEPVRLEYTEYRELRSSTRALAKLTALQNSGEPEVWESGRPKRACINRQKRISADERLVSDNKTYYKVEVLSNKLRSSDKDKEIVKHQVKSNDSEKGLIVKFKKLRNSELVQLNNEATNFLFPKRDDSSDDEEEDEEEENETITSVENNESAVSSSSDLEELKPPDTFKVEDEGSLDSLASDCKRKRKRRSQAEAFILDNQKYYKFETPGSRLRYHGSYLSPVPMKSNGDCLPKKEKQVEVVEKKEQTDRLKINLDDYKFSFESIPENEKWYQTFRRQDRVEHQYNFTNNYFWNDFVLPYQIPHLKPIDPKTCYSAYTDILTSLHEALSQTSSDSSDQSGAESDLSPCEFEELSMELEPEQPLQQPNENMNKIGDALTSPACMREDPKPERKKPGRKRKTLLLHPHSGGGKNPRKSPRQHASTLAILSSLLHQRKRRSKNAITNEATQSLQTIPEEPAEEKPKPVTPQKPRKKKIDYFAVASQIEEQFNTALECNMDLEIEHSIEPDFISFKESKLDVNDIMKMYQESKAKENDKSCRRFFNGTPGRKPGKRKKNKTGWPTIKKRKNVKGEESTLDVSNLESDNEDEEDDDEDNDASSNSIKDGQDQNHDLGNDCELETEDRVVISEIRDINLQPCVYVKKLESVKPSVRKVITSPKRTSRRQRRMPGSPKSPRILRRPRGRWYRER